MYATPSVFLAAFLWLWLCLGTALSLGHAPSFQAEAAPPAIEVYQNSPDNSSDDYKDEDFAPLLLPFALGTLLVALVFTLIVLGFGLAIGLVAAGILAALVGMGILASSTLAGLAKRDAKTGVRALFLQASALGGLALGFLVAWAANFFWETSLGPSVIWLTGGGAGLLAGLILGAIFNLAWEKLLTFLIQFALQLRQRVGARLGVNPNQTAP